MMSEKTVYSATVPGNRGNHGASARFDATGGYIGISQKGTGPSSPYDRVLLSPAQVCALVAFLLQHGLRIKETRQQQATKERIPQ